MDLAAVVRAAVAAVEDVHLPNKSGVRVVVIGDPGTGKSSLISTLATDQFPENVPGVVPAVHLELEDDDYFPDRVTVTTVDTSSRSPAWRVRRLRSVCFKDSIDWRQMVAISLSDSACPCGCSPEQKTKLIAECEAADAVVVTCACDRPATLERVTSFWLPELRRLKVMLLRCTLRFGSDHDCYLF